MKFSLGKITRGHVKLVHHVQLRLVVTVERAPACSLASREGLVVALGVERVADPRKKAVLPGVSRHEDPRPSDFVVAKDCDDGDTLLDLDSGSQDRQRPYLTRIIFIHFDSRSLQIPVIKPVIKI